jgi:hemerythrin-like domain-containing protein
MATKTRSSKAQTNQSPKTSTYKSGSNQKSAFNFGDGNSTNVLIGAAAAGAALGFAANMGRKLIVQATSAASGDWADALATEHKMTLAIFDKILATTNKQTTMRGTLLAKLKYALSKHAIQEEMVIYPALRQEGRTDDADDLTSEHGIVKTYLYELETMPKDSAKWLARVRDFRSMIEEHMREEENKVFPALRSSMSDEENGKLTAMMNKEGFKFA